MNGTIDRRTDRSKPWRARYLAPNGKQPSRSFTTRRDAERWLRDEIGRIDRGSWRDPAGGKRRFADHVDDWINGKLGLKEKTLVGYDSLLRSRILPEFGDTQLRYIHRTDIQAWVVAMDNDDLSPSRIRQAHQLLRATLDQAVHDGLLDSNPAAGIALPKAARREMIALTITQVESLARLSEERQDGARALVTLMAYAGIRWGEAVALRVASFSPLHNRLHITESATEIGGRLVLGTPKSHRIRTLVLPKSVSDTLTAHVSRSGPSPRDLLFTAPQGGPLRSANFRRRVWKHSIQRLASDDPRLASLRVHELRHTAASIAIASGANIMALQRMLGHEKASVTLDVYGHLYTEDLERLAERIDDQLAGVV